jgi:hypothetical protein
MRRTTTPFVTLDIPYWRASSGVKVSSETPSSARSAGGVPDAVTVELRRDTAGKLIGKFLTPTAIDFTKAYFNPVTGIVTFEATDEKSGKHYKLEGKLKGTELIGYAWSR